MRYLLLEQARGFDNGAVPGGVYALLDRYYYYVPLTVSNALSYYAVQGVAGRRAALIAAIDALSAELQRLEGIAAAEQPPPAVVVSEDADQITPEEEAAFAWAVLAGLQREGRILPAQRTPARKDAEPPVPTSVASLRSLPYRDYLRTEHWQRIRKAALARAAHRCQMCKGKARLEVHHNTYERLGYERDSDVIVLCGPCHRIFHKHTRTKLRRR